MNDLAVPPSAGVTLTGLPGQNPFDVVFRSAKPTLDAILQLQPALKWLERHRPGCPIDSEFLKVIPTEQELLHMKRLFRQAEQIENNGLLHLSDDVAIACLSDGGVFNVGLSVDPITGDDPFSGCRRSGHAYAGVRRTR
jgi:hypothetical protein